jgi:hypothetical protein
MGWDQIADTLGGVVVGVVLAVAVRIVAVWVVAPTGRLWMSAAAVVGCVAASIYLVMTPPRARPGRAPAPPVETFAWQMGVADGLAGPPSDSERLPWEFLRIASNLSLDYVPANDTDRHCIAVDSLNAPEGIAALRELRAILSAMPPSFDCGEPCPSCMEVSLQWYLGDDRRVLQAGSVAPG